MYLIIGQELDLYICMGKFNLRTWLLKTTLKLLLIVYINDERSFDCFTRAIVILIEVKETAIALFKVHLKSNPCFEIKKLLGSHVVRKFTLVMLYNLLVEVSEARWSTWMKAVSIIGKSSITWCRLRTPMSYAYFFFFMEGLLQMLPVVHLSVIYLRIVSMKMTRCLIPIRVVLIFLLFSNLIHFY